MDICAIFMHPAANGKGLDLVSAKWPIGDRPHPPGRGGATGYLENGRWIRKASDPRVPLSLDGKPRPRRHGRRAFERVLQRKASPPASERLSDTSILYS